MSSYHEFREELFPFKTFYHLTHYENIKRMSMEGRLWSNYYVQKKYFEVERIDNIEINSRRQNYRIYGTKYKLGQFVPFLVNPRGPFLKSVTDGGKDKSIVMLGFNYSRPNQLYYYSDGNAASAKTKFYKDLNAIDENINANVINESWENISTGKSEMDYEEAKRIHQSEILLYQSVDFNDIKHIITSNDNVKIKLDQIGLNIPVYLVPKMFF